MGTPDFAVPALEALVAAGHDIAAVYSQPPRKAGRGHKRVPSPVQARAEVLGLPVRTPTTLRTAEAHADFAALDLDCAVVVAYGLILPKPILEAPRLGCVNIHASLLPRWRGAAPIQRAIEAGDAETGVTIMRMEEGLDTGPMLLSEAVPITETATGETLHDTLAALGARLILSALDGLAAGTIEATPQPAAGVTYARKLDKAESDIDWTRPATEIARKIRAFHPWPGTRFQVGDDTVKLIAATAVLDAIPPGVRPGTVLDDRLTIACGSGALRPTLLQRPGKGPQPTDAFLRGYPIDPETLLTVSRQ